MQKLAAPRGTADLIPPESSRWQAFESCARGIAQRFGYGEIRTPMFESTELFVRGVGETTDIVEKEMYTFVDKKGRGMALRPEWTAPVVRAVLEHNLLANGPQRLCYLGPIFRYERPQAGRYRQAHQFGVECFGFGGPEADVEVIALAYEVLRSYGVEVVLNLNSIGDEECRPRYREALLAHFGAHRTALSADSQRRLERNPLRVLDSKAPEDQPFIASAPSLLDLLCPACSVHFAGVRTQLDRIGVPYRLDPHIVRGLDYYTRTVFEFVSDHLGAQSTVCAGGRYDGLVESLGGPSTPAVGFAMGIERFLMIAGGKSAQETQVRDGIAVVALGPAEREHVVPLVAALRAIDAAPPVTIDYQDASIGTHFKRADRANARAAVIVGSQELAAHQVTLRDLVQRTQETIHEAPSAHETARLVLDWYASLNRALIA
jgi:histidyl-tRNA synthetase